MKGENNSNNNKRNFENYALQKENEYINLIFVSIHTYTYLYMWNSYAPYLLLIHMQFQGCMKFLASTECIESMLYINYELKLVRTIDDDACWWALPLYACMCRKYTALMYISTIKWIWMYIYWGWYAKRNKTK